MSNYPPENAGEISDGYHTFNELYDHRHALFLALMKAHPTLSWMSRKHDDGSEMEGWFIAGIKAPTGDVTYHLPASMWDLATNTGAAIFDTGMWWDGHTPKNVVDRIQEWIKIPNKIARFNNVSEDNSEVVSKLNGVIKRTDELNKHLRGGILK